MKLPWDIARCMGSRTDGECAKRDECRRYTEREPENVIVMHFTAPVDIDLQTGCELLIPEPQH
jgi:hypothetical protein